MQNNLMKECFVKFRDYLNNEQELREVIILFTQ